MKSHAQLPHGVEDGLGTNAQDRFESPGPPMPAVAIYAANQALAKQL